MRAERKRGASTRAAFGACPTSGWRGVRRRGGGDSCCPPLPPFPPHPPAFRRSQGTCLPVCYAAFLLRAVGLASSRIVFAESFCRVKTLSLTGKLLYPIADKVVVCVGARGGGGGASCEARGGGEPRRARSISHARVCGSKPLHLDRTSRGRGRRCAMRHRRCSAYESCSITSCHRAVRVLPGRRLSCFSPVDRRPRSPPPRVIGIIMYLRQFVVHWPQLRQRCVRPPRPANNACW